MTAAGFTGTRCGMPNAQWAAVLGHLGQMQPAVLHHGAGPGLDDNPSADAQAVAIARSLGIWTVAHPGPDGVPEGFPESDETLAPLPFLVRDWDIAREVANDGGTLLAAPDVMPARFRSGTATTARYAVRQGAAVLWVAPDGTVTGGES